MHTPESTEFILDCSVTMAWCFEDEVTPFSESILHRLSNTKAQVPLIWLFEVVNVLLIAQRRNRISSLKAAEFTDFLRALPIQVDQQGSQRVMGSTAELGKATGLSAYDAAYLELAVHTNLPLATLDKEIKKAAHKMGVSLL